MFNLNNKKILIIFSTLYIMLTTLCSLHNILTLTICNSFFSLLSIWVIYYITTNKVQIVHQETKKNEKNSTSDVDDINPKENKEIYDTKIEPETIKNESFSGVEISEEELQKMIYENKHWNQFT